MGGREEIERPGRKRRGARGIEQEQESGRKRGKEGKEEAKVAGSWADNRVEIISRMTTRPFLYSLNRLLMYSIR